MIVGRTQRESRWSGRRESAQLLAIVVLGATVVVQARSGSGQPVVAPMMGADSVGGSLVLPRLGGEQVLIDADAYCRQVALSVLITHPHDIRDDEIRFIRDKTKPGVAIEQFSRVFGEAIRCGIGPCESHSEDEVITPVEVEPGEDKPVEDGASEPGLGG